MMESVLGRILKLISEGLNWGSYKCLLQNAIRKIYNQTS